MTPVRRHLAAAGGGVIFGADSLKQHLERRDAQQQAKRAVPVVGIDPVDARAQKKPHSSGYGFMAGAGNLEVNLVLALELDFAVVQAAREKHRAVEAD